MTVGLTPAAAGPSVAARACSEPTAGAAARGNRIRGFMGLLGMHAERARAVRAVYVRTCSNVLWQDSASHALAGASIVPEQHACGREQPRAPVTLEPASAPALHTVFSTP